MALEQWQPPRLVKSAREEGVLVPRKNRTPVSCAVELDAKRPLSNSARRATMMKDVLDATLQSSESNIRHLNVIPIVLVDALPPCFLRELCYRALYRPTPRATDAGTAPNGTEEWLACQSQSIGI